MPLTVSMEIPLLTERAAHTLSYTLAHRDTHYALVFILHQDMVHIQLQYTFVHVCM